MIKSRSNVPPTGGYEMPIDLALGEALSPFTLRGGKRMSCGGNALEVAVR